MPAARFLTVWTLLTIPALAFAAEPDFKAWQKALARKTQIMERLPELQKEFRTATENADKERIA